ncbi:unnamed protein product [Clonostachys rosea]|uniref:Uncharacterized protein n=1 Tax=Bionectria ochroleuca TaxID=29856 RepID=A0ABY6U0E7_BIOOC|nr:unnamed protein product [Clonostachys rosea]
MVAIGYLSVALVGLAGLAAASPSEGDLINMESRYVKATFGGPGAAPKWRVRDEADVSLAKRISCASGNCKFPSTFGKPKMAGAIKMRDEDLYERDHEYSGYLTKRISCASGNCKFPSTFGKPKMAGAIKMRDNDYDVSLTKRISCASGNCKFPSTFGKPKMAGAIKMRSEDSLYERDDELDGHLTKRISCASGNCKFPSTFGKPKMAGAIKMRYEDSIYERDEGEGRNPVAWMA